MHSEALPGQEEMYRVRSANQQVQIGLPYRPDPYRPIGHQTYPPVDFNRIPPQQLSPNPEISRQSYSNSMRGLPEPPRLRPIPTQQWPLTHNKYSY